MRRVLAILASCLLLILVSVGTVAAQATPVVAPATPSGPVPSSYPEVLIKATDFHFDMPSQIAAGYTRVTLENDSATNTHHAMFMQLHPGKTVADFEAAAKASAKEGFGALFAVATSVGGPGSIDPGQRTTVIMNLQPGLYVVICAIPDAQGVPHYLHGMMTPVEVTGTAATGPEPGSEATVDLVDFAFQNLPSAPAAGQHVWKVTNKGPMIHEMAIFQLGLGVTPDQFKALLMASVAPPSASPAASPMATGTPMAAASPAASPAAGAPPAIDVAGVAPMSPGQTVWAVLDFQPVTYVAVCFVPDQATGKPHFAEGMFMPFTVPQ